MPETYCILTTEPNELVAEVHTRMPVLLPPETMARWIGDTPLGEGELKLLFRPLDGARRACRPVSRFVSSTRHEGPECLAPPGSEPPEPELDFG